MVLTLEIKGALAEKLGPSARKVFNASGGSIGRLPNNSWALPDPYVSGRHAVITYVDGVFYLEDTSTNGIWVNSQENRLVKGQLYAIRSGDWIFIEPYEISAHISEHEEASPPAKPRANASPFLVDPFAPPHENARASNPPLPPDDPSVADAELDPLALLNFEALRTRIVRPRGSIWRKPIVSEHYAPPRPVVPDPVSSPRPARRHLHVRSCLLYGRSRKRFPVIW
jgi:type VI secretion system FHA domain protein